MTPKLATSIDDVIIILDRIIEEAILRKNSLGYFAALYRKVTLKVKEGIETGYFENGPRMEDLDVIFANRYIAAYYNYKANLEVTQSWQLAFEFSTKFWPIVLQHLLIGMNAHIGLDLGIAAAEVSKGSDFENLKSDFNKINGILAALVNDVEENLSKIWPNLKRLLKFTQKADDFLIDFSMKSARDNAWDFAQQIYNSPDSQLKGLISAKDARVANYSRIMTHPGLVTKLVFGTMRLMELSTINSKIEALKN